MSEKKSVRVSADDTRWFIGDAIPESISPEVDTGCNGPHPLPNILTRSSGPRTCAVCREVKCGSTVLPEEGVYVCDDCTVVGLRQMIVDAEACR